MIKFVGGAAIGMLNATLMTPYMKINNQILNRRAHPENKSTHSTTLRAFDGATAYNLSFLLRISVALSLNELLVNAFPATPDEEPQQKLSLSIISGALAGSTSSTFEGIAQAQQKNPHPISMSNVIHNVYKNNGSAGLFRGMMPMMARSAGFTAGYLSMMPSLCKHLRENMCDHLVADVFSALVSGFIITSLTLPFNTLRFHKQNDFMVKNPAPSYPEITRNILKSEAGLSGFFQGMKPRTKINVFSMFFITECNKLLEVFSEEGFPMLSSPRPRA